MEKFKIKIKEHFKDALRTKFNQSVRRKVIDDWMNRNDIDKERVDEFLTRVVLYLYNVVWNPYDCSEEAESQEEKVQLQIEYMKENYGDVIDKYPLEVLYYIGGVNVCGQIFKDKIFEQPYQNPYDGRFTDKYEDILVSQLGVKRMFKE
jgi:hypothetical protein